MQAILIDTLNKGFRFVEVEKPLSGVYKHIGQGCNIVEVAKILPNDIIYVDEEANMRDVYLGNWVGFSYNRKGQFVIQGMPSIYKGNGIILGFNHKKGCSISTTMTVDKAMSIVRFL